MIIDCAQLLLYSLKTMITNTLMYESQLSSPLAWFYVQNNIISINIAAALLYKAYVVLHSLLSEIDGTLLPRAC